MSRSDLLSSVSLPTYVYELYDADRELIYVGVTGDPAARLASHEATKSWWAEVADLKVRAFKSRAEAFAHEKKTIQRRRPSHNLVHSDGYTPGVRSAAIDDDNDSDVAATYFATAKRWDHGWELHIDGLGVTQTKSLALAGKDAADYVETLTGDTTPKIDITVELGLFAEQVKDLKTAQHLAFTTQSEAAARARALVHDFKGMGMSGDDVARILELSPQRVSQLGKS